MKRCWGTIEYLKTQQNALMITTVVRKESADTKEYESCQLTDMDVDMDEHKEELIFVPSAVSSSAGWRAPKFMCQAYCIAVAAKGWHSSTGSPMQQACFLHHVVGQGR